MGTRRPSLRDAEPLGNGLFKQRWTWPGSGRSYCLSPLTEQEVPAFRAFLWSVDLCIARKDRRILTEEWRPGKKATVRQDRSVTWKTYARDFVDGLAHKPKKPASEARITELTKRLDNWFPDLDKLSMVDVATKDVIRQQRARLKAPRTFASGKNGKTRTVTLAASSRCHYGWFFRSVLIQAAEDGVISADAKAIVEKEFADLERPEKYRRIKDVKSLSLAPECRTALLSAAAVYDGETYHLVRLILNTGLRIGEALALQIKHIGVRTDKTGVLRGYVKVEQALRKHEESGVGRPKGSTEDMPSTAERTVPCPADVVLELLEWLSGQGHTSPNQYCFAAPKSTRANRPWGYRGWHNQRWAKIVALAHKDFGLPIDVKPIPYSLRHTYGSVMLDKGMSLIEVSRLLGHSDTRVTEARYIHEDLVKVTANAHDIAATAFAHDTPDKMPQLACNGWYLDPITGKKTRHATELRKAS